VIIALVMMMSVAAVAIPASAESATLSLGEVKCSANGDVVVPLSIENNPGVWGINLQVSYPAELTYKSITKVNSNVGTCMATAADNVITFLIEASSETANITNDGVLANITFSTTAWEDGKVFAVAFTNVDRKSITNVDGQDLFATEDASGNPLEPIVLKDGAVTCAVGGSTPEQPPVESTTQPSTQPTQPSTQPTQPSTAPSTQPSTQPTQPSNPSITQPTACVHSVVTVGYKKATYFAAGYTGNKVCIKCNGLVEQGKAIAKLKLAKPKFSVKGAKKSFKVTYKKVAGANKFQVRYRIKGSWKVKTFKATKNVTKTIKKLKKGTYKVQVRAMVQSGSKKAYSNWASVKRAKVK